MCVVSYTRSHILIVELRDVLEEATVLSCQAAAKSRYVQQVASDLEVSDNMGQQELLLEAGNLAGKGRFHLIDC